MAVLGSRSDTGQANSLAATLVAISVVIVLLYIGRAFFITLATGVLLAFILEPVVLFFGRIRIPRGPASFLACSLALIFVYLIGLAAWSQAVGLWEELPTYSSRVTGLVDSAVQRIESFEKSATEALVPRRLREQPAPLPVPQKQTRATRRSAEPPAPVAVPEVRIRQERQSLVQFLYENLQAFLDVVLMASFVPFLVYFMLSWRDHMRRAWLNLFQGENRDHASRAWSAIAEAARAYVVGNFILGIFLSVASASFFFFVNVPYWQLVGPLSGFLSLIPYVGLPLAILPPFLAALPVYNELAPYLLIGTTTALFHLLALNLLYPKIVGARVHLNPLAVTVALMFWALLWGGAGLVLAIPITAGIKAVLDNIPNTAGYGRLLGD